LVAGEDAPLLNAAPKRRLLDLAAVLVLTVGGSLLFSINAGLIIENYSHDALWLRLTGRLFTTATALALLFYVLAAQGRGRRDIGLSGCWSDLPWAIVLALTSWYAVGGYNFLRMYFWRGGVMPMYSGHAAEISAHVTPLVVVVLVLSAAYEEVIVRAYLMTEAAELTSSRWLAVALSVALQSSYHIYQGVFQLGAKAVGFLPYALFFAWKRRSPPTILAHFLINLYIVWRWGRI
jgi:membrane protease YdiL (CAAX protease family)